VIGQVKGQSRPTPSQVDYFLSASPEATLFSISTSVNEGGEKKNQDKKM
jgi:hypothetical protein